jgi:hypothetical protein
MSSADGRDGGAGAALHWNAARWGAAAGIFLVSFALIALQLFYMRALSVLRYHHFSYLVISTALLGFGASGTFLSFMLPALRRRFDLWAGRFYLFFTVSIPASYLLTRLLPIDIRYLLYSGDQLLLLGIYNLLVFLPFFFGATLIGMFLGHYARHIPLLYGVNLFGSGLGGLGALGIMFLLPAAQLPAAAVLFAFGAQLMWGLLSEGRRASGLRRELLPGLILGAAVCAAAFLPFPGTGVDQYKTLAHLQRLERQGDAEQILTRYSPRMRLDVYRAPSLHQTLFAGPMTKAGPPPQDVILFDGETAGTLFRTRTPAEAAIMEYTPQSLAYRLAGGSKSAATAGERNGEADERSGSLILGEVGGTNIWLARRFGMERITAVQASGTLLSALKGPLADSGGAVFSAPGVETAEVPPRLYLERSGERFDVIHIASAEGMPAASGGLQSLHENYLLTREGFAAALERLNSGGFLAVTRGIQTPARDNIKLAALGISALRARGVEEPERHILQARNYLAVTTLVSPDPIGRETVAAFKEACEELDMDIEHYPGIDSSELSQRNRIDGPEGKPYSYYHHALREMLSGREESFYRSWVYDVRPPTDDRPYFHNFFKWKSLDRFIETYRGSFLRRMELGYVVLVITLAEITVVAFVLILLPLLRRKARALRDPGAGGSRLPTLLHFGGIGLGFMFLEMMLIQKLALFLGDPMYSASAVITAILVFAGIGSSLQGRMSAPPRRRIRSAAVLVALLAIGFAAFLDPVLDLFIGYSLPLRFAVALAALAPLAFCMGWMLPSGMELVRKNAEGLIPWAWGVNGFASVAAGPLAVMLSIAIGFTGVFACAAGCYAAAGAAAWLWPES